MASAVLDKTTYGQLLKQSLPRLIRTQAENELYVNKIEKLLALGNNIKREEAELLQLLTLIVERFEEERYALNAAGPADVLRELMDARGLKQSELAAILGSKGVTSELLHGKREISKAQARRLARFFNVRAALFLWD